MFRSYFGSRRGGILAAAKHAFDGAAVSIEEGRKAVLPFAVERQRSLSALAGR